MDSGNPNAKWEDNFFCYGIFKVDEQRGTSIKGLFWPPLEPKTESFILLVC